MLYIQAKKINFKYPQAVDNIIEDLSFNIHSTAKIGLIGRNGCGKSTLCKILSGSLKAEGFLHIKDDIRTGYLAQEFEGDPELTLLEYFRAGTNLWQLRLKLQQYENQEISLTDAELSDLLYLYDQEGGYLYEAELEKVSGKFTFPGDYLGRKIKSLSGGEKTRAALAKLLLQKPDLLILDEPTNHLDSIQLNWLEDFLKFSGLPFVVISHDRAFLDKCTNTTWEIDKSLREFSGNYTFYKQQKEEELARRIEQYETQGKKIRQLEAARREIKNSAEKFESFKGERSIKKNGGICQRDEGSGHRLRVKNVMKRAMAVGSRIEKIIEDESSQKPFIEKKREIKISVTEIKNRWVLQLEKLGKNYCDKSVFRDLSIAVSNGSRLAVSGKNGCGKSTLLKILSGRLADFSGSVQWAPQVVIAYYAQEHEDLDPELTVLEEVCAGDTKDQATARTVLGSLNISGDQVYKKTAALSSGEKSKVALARIICSGANVLLLDEPTNHLEISAREAVEQALLNFNGTIIFVSHDRYFVNKLATEIYNLE